MIRSRYNITVSDYPGKGYHLLFNCRTQALVKIDDAFRRTLERLPERLDGPGMDPRVGENLPYLVQNGFVLEDERREEAKTDDFFHQLVAGSASLPFEATILTTYACNFSCSYCFEESVRNPSRLDDATASRTAEWLISHCERANRKSVFAVFYGGEPLLNTAPIYSISRRLGAWAREAPGGKFAFSIITNGSLLTPRLVDDLLPLGLVNIRVSIDGDRASHDSRRPFTGGKPSFDVIIANIRAVIDRVPVSVAGNFDRGNFDGIARLLDFLDAEGLLRKFASLNFLPIAPRLGPRSNPGAVELTECISAFDKDGLFTEILKIKEEFLRRGLRSPSGLAINACSLTMDGAGVTIDPLGDIYTCNALLGYPEFSVGNVASAGFNSRRDSFLRIEAWKLCPRDCPYVPMCQGGCRFLSFVENGKIDTLLCKRRYLDRIVPELIKLEYDNVKGDPCRK